MRITATVDKVETFGSRLRITATGWEDTDGNGMLADKVYVLEIENKADRGYTYFVGREITIELTAKRVI